MVEWAMSPEAAVEQRDKVEKRSYELTPEKAATHTARHRWLPDEPLFVSTVEVAQVLGVNRQTVTKWCRTGEVPSVKVGGDYRIPASWLYKIIERAKAEPTPA